MHESPGSWKQRFPRIFLVVAFFVLVLALPEFVLPGQFPSALLPSLTSFLAATGSRLQPSFGFSPVNPKPGESVQFADTSSGNPTSWQWDLGDGTTSAVQNPSHAYSSSGFFRVVLTIGDGTTLKSVRRTVTVMNATRKLAASFASSPPYPRAGEAVQFNDTSTGGPTSWEWDFGDGTSSTDQNPRHTFVDRGFYRVHLTARNQESVGHASRTVTVAKSGSLASSFTFVPASPVVNQSVQFTDTSAGTPTSWHWDFGDGAVSTVRNPSHAYATAGSKTVSLTVANGQESKTTTRSLNVQASVTSIFSYSPAAPDAGQLVQFLDSSTGNPVTWQWDFGDGSTSTLQSPGHAFSSAGSYQVKLTAGNASGSNTSSQTLTIRPALTASFTFEPASPVVNQTVQFGDTSTGTPTSWSWDFGDGTVSTAQNPSHAYATAGSKTVSLIVAKASGSSSVSRTVTVGPALAASFTFSPVSPMTGQSVQFTDASTGTPTSWSWDFGDGSTSALKNPSHAFSTAGAKTVTLTVTGVSGSASISRTITVTLALVAGFSFSPSAPTAGQAVQFTDTSTGAPTSWSWNFSDGGTATTRNPSHTFMSNGAYGVSLAVANASGSSTATQVVTVAPAAPTASFSFTPSSPKVNQSVQFTDTSTGNPVSWSWDFGDGAVSTAQNPSHTYAIAGTKTVTLTVVNSTGTNSTSRTLTVVQSSAIIINHNSTTLSAIPDTYIAAAKSNLHIAYGALSHGSQLSEGVDGLVKWIHGGSKYAYSNGGAGGTLDWRVYIDDFGGLGIASSLEYDARMNVNYTAWNRATRQYLAAHPEVNVIMWSWCWGANSGLENMEQYVNLMSQLELDFPNVKFVYMTGRTNGFPSEMPDWEDNEYIRNYCITHNKILYDFYDIECYDPSKNYFGDKGCNDACDYDSNGDGVRDANWAIRWQNSHNNPGEWYTCSCEHSQPINGNMKAFAFWHLCARLAGWDGR